MQLVYETSLKISFIEYGGGFEMRIDQALTMRNDAEYASCRSLQKSAAKAATSTKKGVGWLLFDVRSVGLSLGGMVTALLGAATCDA